MTKQEMIDHIESKIGNKIESPYMDEDGLYFTYMEERFYFYKNYNMVHAWINHIPQHTVASKMISELLKK